MSKFPTRRYTFSVENMKLTFMRIISGFRSLELKSWLQPTM